MHVHYKSAFIYIYEVDFSILKLKTMSSFLDLKSGNLILHHINLCLNIASITEIKSRFGVVLVTGHWAAVTCHSHAEWLQSFIFSFSTDEIQFVSPIISLKLFINLQLQSAIHNICDFFPHLFVHLPENSHVVSDDILRNDVAMYIFKMCIFKSEMWQGQSTAS